MALLGEAKTARAVSSIARSQAQWRSLLNRPPQMYDRARGRPRGRAASLSTELSTAGRVCLAANPMVSGASAGWAAFIPSTLALSQHAGI
jgi:hypothetical protein